MNGKGIMNEDIEKFYSDLILAELPLKGILKFAAKFAVPMLVRKLDDSTLEKLPEPWKAYATQLSTSAYLTLLDGTATDEEIAQLVELCACILNEKIDIPLADEEDELAIFKATITLIATLVVKRIRK